MAKTYLQPNNTTQSGSVYKAAIDDSMAVLAETGQDGAPHQATVANLTVLIDALKIIKADGTLVSVAQQTATFVAPVTNPRIDRIVIDMVTGIYSIIAGTEAASPAAPAITAGKLPCAQVSLSVGITQITNVLITDERTAFVQVHPANVGAGTLASDVTVSILDSVTTNTTVASTTTETDLYRYSVPGGILGTNRALRLTLYGNYLNDTGANRTFTLKAKYGATTFLDGATANITNSANTRAARIEVMVFANGATNAQEAFGEITLSGVAGLQFWGANGNNIINSSAYNTMSIDSTAAADLAVTIAHSAADTTFVLMGARLEWLR